MGFIFARRLTTKRNKISAKLPGCDRIDENQQAADKKCYAPRDSNVSSAHRQPTHIAVDKDRRLAPQRDRAGVGQPS